MALPASGPISLNQVNTELQRAATAQINMNDGAVRSLAGKASGVISMSDLRGKSNWIYKTGNLVGGVPAGFSLFGDAWNGGSLSLVFDNDDASRLFYNSTNSFIVGIWFNKSYKIQQVRGYCQNTLSGGQYIELYYNGTWNYVCSLQKNVANLYTLPTAVEATGIRIRCDNAWNPWVNELQVTQWYEKG